MFSIGLALAFQSNDPSVGKITKEALSDQTLLELLVQDIQDNNRFQSASGVFKDIEDWDGLTQSSQDGTVREIDFSQDGADLLRLARQGAGLQPTGTKKSSIDLQWIPSSVTSFSVSRLQLDGTVDTSCLPRGLVTLNLDYNTLSGSFEIAELPGSICWVNIESNNFIGSLRLPQLPPKTRQFIANRNKFEGSLDLTTLPEEIRTIGLSNNKFSGSVDLTRLPRSLGVLRLEMNQIRQKVLTLSSQLKQFTVSVDERTFETVVDTDGNPIGNILNRYGIVDVSVYTRTSSDDEGDDF